MCSSKRDKTAINSQLRIDNQFLDRIDSTFLNGHSTTHKKPNRDVTIDTNNNFSSLDKRFYSPKHLTSATQPKHTNAPNHSDIIHRLTVHYLSYQVLFLQLCILKYIDIDLHLFPFAFY